MAEDSAQQEDLRRVTVRFEGRVQGVGFRFTVVEIARSFAVTGFVRNEMDGSVALVAEGTRKVLESFVHEIKSSHLGRHIYDEHRSWSAATGEFDRFGVSYGW